MEAKYYPHTALYLKYYWGIALFNARQGIDRYLFHINVDV